MNILLITDAYPPEIRSVSHMIWELAEELTFRGNKVTVVTSWPRYNIASEEEKNDFHEFSREKNIGVIRVKTLPHHNVNFIMRGIAQLSMPRLFLGKIKKYAGGKMDTVIVYSPPLPLALVGAKIKKACGAKYLLNIQDIFPQNAIDLSAMKNKVIIKFFEHMEKRAYEDADNITCNTENSRNFLIEKKNIPPQKVKTIYNWVDVNAFEDAKATGEFRRMYGLENKFIFLFPGILGPSQGLGFILKVAERIRNIPEICFLFVGDGIVKKQLQNALCRKDLQNVRFQPFVSREDFPFLVKEADVGLACLSIENKTPVIPGKIFGFMASSLPIAAFLNKESDAHQLIKDAQCGYSMLSENEEEAANLIRKVFNERNKLAQYGRNGYNYAVNHFSKKMCIDKMRQLL